jgi:hypothetical protein
MLFGFSVKLVDYVKPAFRYRIPQEFPDLGFLTIFIINTCPFPCSLQPTNRRTDWNGIKHRLLLVAASWTWVGR